MVNVTFTPHLKIPLTICFSSALRQQEISTASNYSTDVLLSYETKLDKTCKFNEQNYVNLLNLLYGIKSPKVQSTYL